MNGPSSTNSRSQGTGRISQYLLRSDIGHKYIGIVEVLLKMLQLNPVRRISAKNALNQTFFRQLGSTTDPMNLPELKWEEMHQLKASERRKKDKEREGVKPDFPRPPELV
jgi:serine/threonine protein kinase